MEKNNCEVQDMYQFPIGVILDSFRKPVPEALALAQGMGVQGIQVYSTYGDLSPKKLVGAKRREFLDLVKSHGLVISALCGDLGHGFGNAEKNPQLIEDSKRILDLAKELEKRFKKNAEAIYGKLINLLYEDA